MININNLRNDLKEVPELVYQRARYKSVKDLVTQIENEIKYCILCHKKGEEYKL